MNNQGPENQNESKPEEKPQEEPEVRPFVPEIIKKPQFQPPKFKYVPPKAGKRHF